MHRWEYNDLAELLRLVHTMRQALRWPPTILCFSRDVNSLSQKNTRWIPSLSGWKRLPSIWLPCGNSTRKQCQKLLHISCSLWMQVTNTMDCIVGRMTHYQVNAVATGNWQWSCLDIDLYTQFFDSTSHSSDQCPVRPQRARAGKRPVGSSSFCKRKWPGDVCFRFNASGDCPYKSACKFRHVCGSCGGKHPAKSCEKEWHYI